VGPTDLAAARLHWRRGDVASLAAALESLAGPDPRLDAMVGYAISDASVPPPALAPRDGREAAFLRQIGRVHAHRRGSGAPAFREVAPSALDWIARDAGPPGWSAAQWLNFLLLRAAAPSDRVAVVATVRDEGLALVEFVAHYRVLGAGHIFLYTNDNADGSDALLDALAANGLVRVIANDVQPAFSPQRKAYGHALHFLPELYDCAWALFVDADEFFIPSPEHDLCLAGLIRELDRGDPARLPGAVLFDWHWYVSGCRYNWSPGLALERFVHTGSQRGFKSLVRLDGVMSMMMVHFPILCPGVAMLDGDLAPVAEPRPWGKPPSGSRAGHLNHYWTKSFEEFSIKKARGDALAAHKHAEWARGFDLFFKWNANETEANFAPPPVALVAAVRAEHDRIMALPGVAEAMGMVVARLPAMLARFGPAGGLRAIYDRVRDELRGGTA
jgi:hypothetical protein